MGVLVQGRFGRGLFSMSRTRRLQIKASESQPRTAVPGVWPFSSRAWMRGPRGALQSRALHGLRTHKPPPWAGRWHSREFPRVSPVLPSLIRELHSRVPNPLGLGRLPHSLGPGSPCQGQQLLLCAQGAVSSCNIPHLQHHSLELLWPRVLPERQQHALGEAWRCCPV